jgi:hypothetical protein
MYVLSVLCSEISASLSYVFYLAAITFQFVYTTVVVLTHFLLEKTREYLICSSLYNSRLFKELRVFTAVYLLLQFSIHTCRQQC